MKALIRTACMVVCHPGSVVEVSEDQFKALGDRACPVREIALAEKPEKATEKAVEVTLKSEKPKKGKKKEA